MNIKLTFLGAAQNVTGSRYLLDINGFKLLIDCGFFQERKFQDRNWDPFPVHPNTIDAVLLTHAHLDHCGLLPKLVKEGYSGKIYGTSATTEIAKVIIMDAAHIQEEDAEFKKKRHKRKKHTPKRPVEPLYTKEDAQACYPLFHSIKYQTPLQLAEGIEATFYDAGHILGSSSISLKITQGGESRKIVFSGDIGRCGAPILRDPTLLTEADYVLVESTYGDRIHESNNNIKSLLADAVNRTYEAGGNLVVPSFAVERSQELIYYLNELTLEDRIPNIMTFLDSPMAIKVTQVFKDHPEMYDEDAREYYENYDDPFHFPGLKMTSHTRESKAINHIKGTIMVIAGSGMCTGGRVKHHLAANISRPESTILFVGYQAHGTLGRIILDKPEEVRLFGEMHEVKANIERIHGFSGHADRDELTKWLSGFQAAPKNTFIVHGEAESSKAFGEHIEKTFGWKTTLPEYQQEVILD